MKLFIRKRTRSSFLGCRRLLNCLTLFLFLLLVLLLCTLLFLFTELTSAAAQVSSTASLAVYMLIDNSNSMDDMGSVGSDPNLWRIDAARLFISYLGVDDGRAAHECGVIFFGSEAEVVVPLTLLDDDNRRQEIFNLIREPPRMGWTDQAAAIALARTEFERHSGAGQPVVVLLTDGKPEWSSRPTAAERQAYVARLQDEAEQLKAAGIPLFIILLANEATDADPEISALWQPIWQEMAGATAPGRFFEIRQAEALIGVYHDIVLALTGGHTAGAVLEADLSEADVAEAGLRQLVAVEPDLARLTFVVSKSRPDLNVTILLPDDTPLTTEQAGVRYAGLPGSAREEIWVIDAPPPGDWTVLITGAGRVTVWKDYHPAAPTPALTSTMTRTSVMTPTATFTPTATPSPEPTSTPTMTAGPSYTPTSTRKPIFTRTATVTPAGIVEVVDGDVPAPQASSPFSFLWWGAITLVLLSGGTGGVLLWRRQRQQHHVQGELHLVTGPGFANGRTWIELDTLNKPQITVGLPPADVPITGAAHRFSLHPGPTVGDSRAMLISGPAEILIDGRPLSGEQRLDDNVMITLGNVTLRYENLPLRSAARTLFSLSDGVRG